MSDHYFIGIPISEKVKEQLIKWQDELIKHMNYKTWTEKEDFHITLKFLGACSDDKVEKFIKNLRMMQSVHSFSLTIGPADSFGNESLPRVFFASVEHHPVLHALKQQVEGVAESVGWKAEQRPYRPHVTIAKKGAEGKSPLIENGSLIFQEQFNQPVHHFHLYKIHPNKHPKYEVIATFPLQEEGHDGAVN